MGDITPGGVYAHIDQSLGSWKQRPMFKSNVKSFVSLRRVLPPLSLADLRKIATLFPAAGHEFQLGPEYEPTDPSADAEKTIVFRVLQNYNRVNLVVPVGAPHMYYAAIESKTVKLTALGEHRRRLVSKSII